MKHTDPAPEALTAREFFARELDGCSKTDAHRATGIAYSTIHDIAAKDGMQPRKDTLQRLQDWSLRAAALHGVYISALRTLGIEELARTGSE